MSELIQGVMRHALFGTQESPDKIYIVPENEVHFEIQQTPAGKRQITAKFKGQTIKLPLGTAAQFIQPQAITGSGGFGYHEQPPANNNVSPLIVPR